LGKKKGDRLRGRVRFGSFSKSWKKKRWINHKRERKRSKKKEGCVDSFTLYERKRRAAFFEGKKRVIPGGERGLYAFGDRKKEKLFRRKGGLKGRTCF